LMSSLITARLIEIGSDGRPKGRGPLTFVCLPRPGDRIVVKDGEMEKAFKVLYCEHFPHEPDLRERVAVVAERSSRFEIGHMVKHGKFGEGRVLSVEGSKLVVQFGVGRKMVLDSFVERARWEPPPPPPVDEGEE
jgi:hypothetical protein